jgi:hypothetical protein
MVEPDDNPNHRHEDENAKAHDATPADHSPEVALDPFASYRREEQDAAVAEQIVVQRHDVLLGRGKGMETHYGNQLFQRTSLHVL